MNTVAKQELARYDAYLKRLVDGKLALPFFSLAEVLAVSNAELAAASEVIEAAKIKGEAPDLRGFDLSVLREAVEILKMSEWSLLGGEGPLWFRGYATWPDDVPTRAKVFNFLDKFELARVVVGHTPSRDGRIVTRFDRRVVLIDTGMLSTVYKGRPSALEIRGSVLSALYEDGVVPLA
ncbi:MAG: hypothetical protein H0T71_00650 [Acidobacteria bacterium]|nr:hypothetical protein [Acidobacteriota bacterium]